LTHLASDDPALRVELCGAAAQLLAELAPTAPAAEARDEHAEPARADAEPLSVRTLSLGASTVQVSVRGVDAGGVADDAAAPPAARVVPRSSGSWAGEPASPPARDWSRELELASRSARIKSRGCEWVARAGPPDERAQILVEARAQPRCWVWALDPSVPEPSSSVLDLCARAYANFAVAIDVVRLVPTWASGEEEPDRDALFLLAEAQSALRGALRAADLEHDDDQMTVFRWLKEQTSRHRVYVDRFMRLDDVADPARWDDLAERLDELEERVSRSEALRRARRKLSGKLAYQLGHLDRAADDATRRGAWSDILRTLDEWVRTPLPPSARELCEGLAPVVDDLPDGLALGDASQQVLEAVDRWIAAQQERAADVGDAPVAPLTVEVREVRALLAGRVAILIGGEKRDRERSRLERDLGLSELRWLSTRPHRSIDPLVGEIQRPEVALVLVASRWSDHAFAELKTASEKAGKIFVKLPGGYGTNQVAHHVVNQASERLRRLG